MSGGRSGGNVALQLAWRYPERFAGVIPVEAAEYSPGFFFDWWQHPHANAAQVCASGVWDLMAPQSPDHHDLRDKLHEIDGDKCPVVMTTGAYDYLTTPEMTEATASRIKGAEFIEMQDIGHFPMSENYPVFRKYLVQALARIEARLGAPV